RYCFDQEETLTTLKLVFAAEKAIAESKKKAKNQAVKQNESESRSPTEYAHVPQPQSDRDARTNSYYADTNTAPATTKSSSAKINLLVPIIWLVVTFFLTVADLNKPINAFPLACENLAQENLDYCLLAGEMMGAESLDLVVENLPEPLEESEYLVSEAMMSNGSMSCELQGNIAAGVPLKEATPFKTPVLNSSPAEILPDFYVSDVEQTNLQEGDLTVRTVCFFSRTKKIGKRYSIEFLAYDQVDLDWPSVPYEATNRVGSLHTLNKTTHAYNFLSLFGVNTLFTAIAIYLVAICGMAIKADSIETIYQASFVLGMTKSILSFLPIFGGLFILVPVECVALGITTGFVKGFNLDWNCGYHFVAATAMLLIILRTLFTFLFLGFLSFIFG
ncbi:MAG: hypothetical protein AAFO95_11375, partial [Cyanobacteria bacterium J06600_6]